MRGVLLAGIWEDVLHISSLSASVHCYLSAVPGMWQPFCDYEVSLSKRINQDTGESRAESQS